MAYAIKADIADPTADRLVFEAQKTMYGGIKISAGDTVFLFASENEGGRGLIAKGIVTASMPIPLQPDIERQTPRVTVQVDVAARAKRPLGRTELKGFTDRNDGRPETELNFKFYRQATNKIVGISDVTAAFLNSFF